MGGVAEGRSESLSQGQAKPLPQKHHSDVSHTHSDGRVAQWLTVLNISLHYFLDINFCTVRAVSSLVNQGFTVSVFPSFEFLKFFFLYSKGYVILFILYSG